MFANFLCYFVLGNQLIGNQRATLRIYYKYQHHIIISSTLTL